MRVDTSVVALYLVISTLGVTPVLSQTDGGVHDVVVKGQALAADDIAYSATILDSDDIRLQTVTDFDELFRQVPGMSVRDLGLGGVANNIVIRGFGGGGHGGDLGAVVDGIPLNEAMSHADGYVDFNVIVPLEVEKLTVFHGPVSALYGNYNRGGLVSIETRKSGNYMELDGGGGSFATGDLQFALGRALGSRQQLNLAGQLYLSDGYRPRSDSERQTFSGRWSIDPTPGLQFALSTRLHRADASSASYLTEAQFRSDPYGIDERAQNDGAKKDFATFRADMNARLSASTTLIGFAYLTRQEFRRWFSRPVGGGTWRQREESYERDVFGVGASLNGEFVAGHGMAPWTYVAGIETFREQTEFQFYDGLVRRSRVSPALNDRETRLNSISAFTELTAPLHSLLNLSLGLRGDRFTGGCERFGPEAGDDPCGDLETIEQLSPKIGVRSELASWFQLRANWAKGFALPNNFVKYAIGGQDLDANVFRQTEVGLKLRPFADLTLDVAAFRLISSDEIRTVAPGIYENFGRTRRKGVEMSGEWTPTKRLRLRAVYNRTETAVKQNADARLIGKDVAGVPNYTANFDVNWSPVDSWSFDARWRLVGSYAVDALNTRYAESYRTLDLGVARHGTVPIHYRAYIRLDNVMDKTYATSVSVIGGEALFAPGAPRAVRAGVQINL